jgi:hypothetical protein
MLDAAGTASLPQFLCSCGEKMLPAVTTGVL